MREFTSVTAERAEKLPSLRRFLDRVGAFQPCSKANEMVPIQPGSGRSGSCSGTPRVRKGGVVIRSGTGAAPRMHQAPALGQDCDIDEVTFHPEVQLVILAGARAIREAAV